jgi:hypothetical protein
MNDRIAKLYDQAIVIEDGGDYVCGELDPEKFAKLLIEECAELAKHHVMNISTYRDAEFVDQQIKQHFG